MSKPTQKKRLSRYSPDETAFPDLVLRERDHTILRLVCEHRFLSGELLWHLLTIGKEEKGSETVVGSNGKKRPVKYGFGIQALSKRLKQLYNARYLERHYITDQPMGRGYGSPRAIYGLGPRSPKVIQELVGIPTKITRRIVESNKVKSPFLRHALETAKFRVTLELACQRSQGYVRLLFWEQGESIRDFVVVKNKQDEDERYSVHGDAFFGLEIKGRGKANYFLEIDRGTESIVSGKQKTDIKRKLIGYRYYRARSKSKKISKFEKRYAYKKLPDGKVIGLNILNEKTNKDYLELLKGFQVLFVTPGSVSRDKSVSGRIANILSILPSLGEFYTTNTLYWFTSPNSINLDNPESIFGAIWITPNPIKPLQSFIL